MKGLRHFIVVFIIGVVVTASDYCRVSGELGVEDIGSRAMDVIQVHTAHGSQGKIASEVTTLADTQQGLMILMEQFVIWH